jgi:hypothetical protein
VVVQALLLLLFLGPAVTEGRFALASPKQSAAILISDREPAYVRIAANDLISDVRRIAGRTLPVVRVPEGCKPGCVVLASIAESADYLRRFTPDLLDSLAGKSEAFQIRTVGSSLVIAGSDPRGVLWGLYDFLERELGVDPMYLWTGFTPKRRPELAWDSIDRGSGEPSFRFSGWFLNEDGSQTERKAGGGPRDND